MAQGTPGFSPRSHPEGFVGTRKAVALMPGGRGCPRPPSVPDRPTAIDPPIQRSRGGQRPNRPCCENDFLDKLVPRFFVAVGIEIRRLRVWEAFYLVRGIFSVSKSPLVNFLLDL